MAWTVNSVRVLSNGSAFAASIEGPTSSGVRWRGVAVDAEGGCARPITAEIPVGFTGHSLGPAAAGGGTVAALVRCNYQFPCGTRLHANGVEILDMDAGTNEALQGSAWTHDIAVGSDGRILAVTGPAAGSRIQATYPDFAPDRLIERWVTTHVVAFSDRASPEDFVDVAVLPDGNIALALMSVSDAGPGVGRVELQTPDFVPIASWPAPLNATVTKIAAGKDRLAVAGETVIAGNELAWVAELDARTLALVWEQTVVNMVGLPFQMSFSPAGMLVLGVSSTAGGVQVSAYDPTGAYSTDMAGPRFPPPAGETFSDLAVASDGDLLISADGLVSYCPLGGLW